MADAIGIDEFRPEAPRNLVGFDYPAHRYPGFLRMQRSENIDELMPIGRAHVRSRYGRSGLGDIQPGDKVLIVTYPHQHELAFEAIRRAMLEDGAERVGRRGPSHSRRESGCVGERIEHGVVIFVFSLVGLKMAFIRWVQCAASWECVCRGIRSGSRR